MSNRKPFNPLEPKYQLPKSKPIELAPPKFLRDQFSVDDIEGAKPKPIKQNQIYSYVPTDIEGSSPKKQRIRKDNLDRYFNYNDISEHKFKSNRSVNPLEPIYEFNQKE